jgi:hypothetical protein
MWNHHPVKLLRIRRVTFTAPDRMKSAAETFALMLPMEIRYCSTEQEAEAWAWMPS